MNTITGAAGSAGKISIQTQPLADRLEKRDTSFADRLSSAIGDVNSKQNIADRSIEDVISGKLGIQDGMIALQKADISLRLMIKVRGKVLDAYREIMHMQI